MNLRLPLIVVCVFFFCKSMLAQDDSSRVVIAADTLSSDLQEDGLSVAAIAHYNDGLVYFQNNESELAVDAFTKALNEEPGFSRAIYNRAGAYLKLENYPAVISDLNDYIALEDSAREAFYLRARAYHISGFPEKALEDYSLAIQKEVELENAFLYSAELNFRNGNYSQAEMDYTGALRQNPKSDVAFHDRGSTRKLLNKLDAAAE